MFPITVTHRHTMDYRSSVNYQEYFRNELQKLEVTEITSEEKRIRFRISMFDQGKKHPMGIVDKGFIEIDPNSGKLLYTYSTLRMGCIALMISIVFTCFLYASTGFAIFGVVTFVWVYGATWFLTYFMQKSILKKMVEGLNK